MEEYLTAREPQWMNARQIKVEGKGEKNLTHSHSTKRMSSILR